MDRSAPAKAGGMVRSPAREDSTHRGAAEAPASQRLEPV